MCQVYTESRVGTRAETKRDYRRCTKRVYDADLAHITTVLARLASTLLALCDPLTGVSVVL